MGNDGRRPIAAPTSPNAPAAKKKPRRTRARDLFQRLNKYPFQSDLLARRKLHSILRAMAVEAISTHTCLEMEKLAGSGVNVSRSSRPRAVERQICISASMPIWVL